MKHILFSFFFFCSGLATHASAELSVNFTKKDTLKSPDLAQEAELERINSISKVEQVENAQKVKGDKAFRTLGYMKAVELYQNVQTKKGVVTEEMMQRLAEAYRLNGETQLAEYWYARFIQNTSDAQTVLHYAQVLQSNNKCEDATRWFTKYASLKDKASAEISACEIRQEVRANKSIQVEPLYDLNSNYLDFSPIPYRGGLVFTSTRPQDKQVVRRDAWTKEAFSSLWLARKNGQEFAAPVAFAPNLDSRFHDGTATFSSDGKTMIFTRSNPRGKDAEGVVDLKLFITQKAENAWSTPIELPFNSSAYNTCHPTLSADGKTLYFASDMPGTFGGMDIFMVKAEAGKWSAPVNLGPLVNTNQNELFPFIAADETLYFSSNGHAGLGGLDIFQIEKGEENDDFSWQNRQNVGQRINSTKDDFGYVVETEGKGYFTSNRRGGTGKDDIYRWVAAEEELSYQDIVVVDDATNKRIAAVTVKIVRRKNGVKVGTEDFFSDTDGQLTLPTRKVEQYVITATKDGYDEQQQEVSALALGANDKYEMRLRKRVLTLRGIVKDGVNNQNIAAANVTLLNKCTDKTLTLVSNAKGKFTFNLNCNCDYELLTSKGDFMPGELTFSTNDLDCNSTKFVDKMILMSPVTKEEEKKEVFTKGDVIVLENLYYDFDKFDIRSDAAYELDKVVDLLRRYPSMKLSLRSHTDSRGEGYYNQWLSRKRAEKAVEYIISKGIVGDRVKARGFGETLLTNDCTNGVECDEEAHQANRRTEIKILELKENVEVRYQKN